MENRAVAIHIEHFINRLEKEKKLDLKVKTEKKKFEKPLTPLPIL